jgi:DNA-binding MurR/RpiR family transcriptional regulator
VSSKESGRINEATSVVDVVARLQRIEPALSPAERRVAEAVRRDFEAATHLTIAELARQAGVSQPTVTRFCRSVGSSSFGAFKISLATTLTVASVCLRSDRSFGDEIGQLAQSVMMGAARALREAVDQVDSQVLAAAIEALATSRRIDIYGLGAGSSVLCEDAKLRLFRLGLPVCAYVDGHQQRMSAATLQPGDAVLGISNSGHTKAVVHAVEIARSFGATTIALTRPDTPLAKAAQIVIAVTVAEGGNVCQPTPSRYVHMGIIDTLATGLAARLGARARESMERVRHTLAKLGVVIPTPANDPPPARDEHQLRD